MYFSLTKLFIPLILLIASTLNASPRSQQTDDSLIHRIILSGYINDFANVMGRHSAELEPILVELEEKTGAQIVLVTLPSLEGGEISDFTVQLFERWGIGQQNEDNGVLLLTSIEDRQIRIEVGYGLEPIITDSTAGRILDEIVIPLFQQEEYGMGLTAGVASVATIIATEGGIELTGLPSTPSTRQPAGRNTSRSSLLRLLFLLFLLPIFIRNPWLALFILSSQTGGFRGGGFGRGGGGGAFGGFGGGMSGGGGAMRSW